MNRNLTLIQVFGLLFLASLAGCSGDGDTSTPPPASSPAASAEGLWNGTTNTGRTVTGVVLDDGGYWFLYSVVGNSSIIAGVIQGDSSSSNGILTSSNATDFSVERATPILNPTVEGNYTVKKSLSGTISYQNTKDTFTTTYDSDYDLTPDVNTVVGTYIGPVAVNETATVAVSPAGGISGTSSTGCTFIGSFSPRTNGNAFDVAITFGGQPACGNGSDTVRGVGLYDIANKRLYSAALNTAKSNGFVFIGTKQ